MFSDRQTLPPQQCFQPAIIVLATTFRQDGPRPLTALCLRASHLRLHLWQGGAPAGRGSTRGQGWALGRRTLYWDAASSGTMHCRAGWGAIRHRTIGRLWDLTEPLQKRLSIVKVRPLMFDICCTPLFKQCLCPSNNRHWFHQICTADFGSAFFPLVLLCAVCDVC